MTVLRGGNVESCYWNSSHWTRGSLSQDLLKIMLTGKCAFNAIDKLGCFKQSNLRSMQGTMSFYYRVNFFSTSNDVSSIQLKIEYQNMADGLLRGDRACLARLITLIESQRSKWSLLDWSSIRTSCHHSFHRQYRVLRTKLYFLQHFFMTTILYRE